MTVLNTNGLFWWWSLKFRVFSLLAQIIMSIIHEVKLSQRYRMDCIQTLNYLLTLSKVRLVRSYCSHDVVKQGKHLQINQMNHHMQINACACRKNISLVFEVGLDLQYLRPQVGLIKSTTEKHQVKIVNTKRKYTHKQQYWEFLCIYTPTNSVTFSSNVSKKKAFLELVTEVFTLVNQY